jgi:surface polysaccharide O-acyltransferase-like enzyme
MTRRVGVDVMRVVAIVAVIAIHTTPFEEAARPIGTGLDAATLINQATRFAVPFFFVIAGYFWARKVGESGETRATSLAMIKRLAWLWGAWCLVYLLPVNLFDALAQGGALGPIKVIYWNVVQAVRRPAILVLEGTRPPLWFLVALVMCVGVSALFLHLGARLLLVALAALLYVVGLLGQSYAAAPFGFALGPSFRNGHFFALAFFVTGVLMQQRGVPARPATALRWGVLLLAGGFVLQLVELHSGHRLWGLPLARDYLLGTYPFGVGAAWVGLGLLPGEPGAAQPRRPAAWAALTAVAGVGPWVLGIYLSHFAFVELLRPLDRRFSPAPWWELAYVAIVLVLAYGLTRLLARGRATRRFVT